MKIARPFNLSAHIRPRYATRVSFSSSVAGFFACAFGAGATDWLLLQLKHAAAEAHVEAATHPVLDDPAAAITRVAAEERADLVVVGSGSARGRRCLAHVPKAVMDHVGCAVLVV